MATKRITVAHTLEARTSSSATAQWAGRIISGLLIAFLLFDAIGKLVRESNSVQGTIELGYPDSVVVWIGLTLLISTILYAIPRAAIVGAILLTGYLGGAIATQVHVEDPWFLFPAVLAVLVWLGLSLRDNRLRAYLSQ